MKLILAGLMTVMPTLAPTAPPIECGFPTFTVNEFTDYVSAGHGLYRKVAKWQAQASFTICDGSRHGMEENACQEDSYVPTEEAPTRAQAVRLIVRDVERALQ